MVARSGLQSLLKDFASRNGVDPLQPDSRGRFHIVVDDELQVQCFERFDQLHFVSPLGVVPESGKEGRSWLQHLLNCALRRMKHSRSTPALEGDNDAILVTRLEVRSLSVHDFETGLEEHINSFAKYRPSLAQAQTLKPIGDAGRSFLRP